MNSKESFLKELQSGLAVLAESEQQDILAEYAQHIDMRMAGGLTEEEAIRDFGDIRQLTAEILAAYHVNPSYAAGGGKTVHLPNPRPTLGRVLTRLGGFLQSIGHRIAAVFAKAGRAVTALPRRLAHRLRALTCRNETQPLMEQESEAQPMDFKQNTDPSAAGRTGPVGHFFRQLGRGLGQLIRLAAWLVWNGVLLLCALPFVALGLFALVCLGLLLVWLTQGMPLAGMTLGCVGILATCIGVLGLGSGLIWRRKRAAPASQSVEDAASQAALVVQEELASKEGLQDAWE